MPGNTRAVMVAVALLFAASVATAVMTMPTRFCGGAAAKYNSPVAASTRMSALPLVMLKA